ncbi:MAG: TIGR01244 family sulfur transferase [Pseudomonadota bacterium]
MDIRNVTENFSVSPQITESDVAKLAEAGFDTIICNRPDDEDYGQAGFAAIERAAKDAGLACHHVPVESGLFGPQHVAEMKSILEQSSGKVLAYCRSGTRSIMLWAFQEVNKRPRDEVVQIAANAGYDLSQQL